MLRCVLACLLGISVLRAGDRPNIVLILADDFGYGDATCYNPQAKVATPQIDRLARQGMRFTDAHSPATVCTPTRYGLLTGQMPFRVPRGGTVFTGAGGPSLLAAGRTTVASLLRQQGYATWAVGKWHLGLTFRDSAGQAIHDGRPEAIRRIDFTRPIEGGPLEHGFERFFRNSVLSNNGLAVCIHRWRSNSCAAEHAAGQVRVAQTPVRE